MGKVYCKLDANYSPIKVGTLLTTSSTPGHAMKSEDSVIRFHHWEGITSLEIDRGLIPILIALQ